MAFILFMLSFFCGNAQASDAFLYYPFNDSAVKLQQGWIYTFSENAHKGIDYIKGTVDDSSTWATFDVLAAADGYYTCTTSGTWGNYCYGEHVIGETTYYTIYAHLESYVTSADTYRSAGEYIGAAGLTGSASNGVLHLHFELSINGYGSQCGCKVDPYGIEAKRSSYPEYGGECATDGPNYFTSCPPIPAGSSSTTSSTSTLITTALTTAFSEYNSNNTRRHSVSGVKESPNICLTSANGVLHWWDYASESSLSYSDRTYFERSGSYEYTTVLTQDYTGTCTGAIVYDDWGGAGRTYTIFIYSLPKLFNLCYYLTTTY